MKGARQARRFLSIDRYLMREFIGPFAGAVIGFTIILLSGLLFELTDLILVKKVPAGTVVRMLLYKLPSLTVVSLPIGVLFATLLGLGRLVKDGELTALRGSGLSFRRLSVPFLFLALVVSGVTVWANERIVPWANHQFETLVRQIVFRDPLPTVEERVFFRDGHGTVFYIREVNHRERTLHDVMIYETEERDGSFPRIITAKRGTFEDALWHLEDVVTRTLDEEGYVENELRAPTLLYPLTERSQNFFGTQKTTDEMTRRELRDHIELFQRSGIEVRAFVVDYHLKLALPFASFLFALTGSPLSLRSARSGRFYGITVSLVLSFLYFVLTSVSRSLGINGVLPTWVAAWLPTVMFLCFGGWLLYRADAPFTRSRRRSPGPAGAGIIAACLFMAMMGTGEGASAWAASRSIVVEAEEYGLWQGTTQTFTARGNVRVTDGDIAITADRMTYDMDVEEIIFTGNVIFRVEDSELRGTSLRYRVPTQEGWLNEVDAVFYPDLGADPIFLFGDSIHRDPDRIVITQARLTTCRPGEPPYHFSAKTVEIVPNEYIRIRSARFVEHGITLAYWPSFVIPLKEERRRFDMPRVGYNDKDGWYVKWTHHYFGPGSGYGALYVDYYQRRGVGVGGRHVYRDTESYRGEVYAYTVPHPQEGRDYEFEWNQRWRSRDGTELNLELGREIHATGTALQEDIWRTRGSVYRSFNRGVVELNGRFLDEGIPGQEKIELDAAGRVTYRLNREWQLSLQGSAFRDVREVPLSGGGSQPRDVGRYTYLARAERRWGDNSLLIDVEQLVHPTLTKIKRGEEDRTTREDWRTVHRLPEVTFTHNRRWGNLPMTLRVSAGHFRQESAKLNAPPEERYVEDTRFMLSTQMRGYTLRLTPTTYVTARATTSAFHYGKGTDEGRWQLGFESRLSLNWRPLRPLRLSADYDYRTSWGSTPFRFDAMTPLSTITPRAQWISGPWNLLATTRYDFRTQQWGNLVNQVVYRNRNLDARLYTTYSIESKTWGDLVATLQTTTAGDYTFRMGARYSLRTSELTQLDMDGTLPIGETWRVGTRMIYDVKNEKFSSAWFRLTKDLACREISFSYDHIEKEYWIEYQIFAFPMSRVKVGHMEEDATFLFESDILKELLEE